MLYRGATRRSFNIDSLESKELMKLFRETKFYIQGVKVEMIHDGRDLLRGEAHPAAIVGFDVYHPTIRFVDSLNREQRIEVIAHEMAHLLLIHKYELGVIGRRIPHNGYNEDVFLFYMSMSGDWVFLLGQISNTVHHLVLGEYLRKEYGIESHLHFHLLHHNLRVILGDGSSDKESLYAKGLIAFEYEKLIGKLDRIFNPYDQTDQTNYFWKAYHMAQEHFGTYSFQSIPTPSNHRENILSFLEDLGYEQENFTFFP
jgi:hypothetical protein